MEFARKLIVECEKEDNSDVHDWIEVAKECINEYEKQMKNK